MDTGGQPVKTRELYYSLCNEYGAESIFYIETFGWKKHPLKVLKQLHSLSSKCKIFIMLPAHNGLDIFARLLTYYKRRKNIRIFYDVIGGWLPEKTKNHLNLVIHLKKFDSIWVETSSMLKDLKEQGIINVKVLPNFKNLKILNEGELCRDFRYPFKVCTFSRVLEKKGIEDAILAVEKINSDFGLEVFHLDVYGQVDETYSERFKALQKVHSNSMTYKGVVSPNESVATIKKYYALLFPTKFFTEGIPGTIIDAYAAGVPVITSLWSNYSDIFIEGVTGWGYEFGKQEAFLRILKKAADKPEEFLNMKESCLNEAWKYHTQTVVKTIDEYIR